MTLSGSNVTSWKSLEGNSYDFSQTTASKQPTYLASSSIGSKPALSFDGGDLLVHSAASLVSTAGTLFIVARMSSTGGGFPVMFSSSDEATGNYFCTFYSYGNATHNRMGFSQRNNDTEDALRGSTVTAINTNYIFGYSTNGTTTAMELNGTTQTVSPFGGGNNGDWLGDTDNRDNTVVGCRKITGEFNFFLGQVAEVIAYSSDLSDGDKTTVRDYLSDRYSIAV